VLRTSVQYRLQQRRLRHYPYLDIDPARALVHLDAAVNTAADVVGEAAEDAEPVSRARAGNS
jgi:hypothetical protein